MTPQERDLLIQMFQRIDAAVGGKGTELADPRIDRFGAAFDIRVVAEFRIPELHPLPDLGETAELRVAERC